jgi:hypothetical protein
MLELPGERSARDAVFVDYEYVFVCRHASSALIATNRPGSSILASGYIS